VDNWKNLFLVAGIGDKTASQYVELFAKHEIAWDMLRDLTHEVLSSVGIWKAGDRIRILRVKQLGTIVSVLKESSSLTLATAEEEPRPDSVHSFALGKHVYIRAARPTSLATPVAAQPATPSAAKTPQKPATAPTSPIPAQIEEPLASKRGTQLTLAFICSSFHILTFIKLL